MDDQVEKMQIEWEKSEKQEEILKWSYVAVTDLFADADEITIPINLGNGVWLGPVPEWVMSRDVMEGLSAFDRACLDEARWALWKEYESSPVLGAPEPTDKNGRSIQESIGESVMCAALAFWMTGDGDILSYRISVHAQYENNHWMRRQFSTHSPFILLDSRKRTTLLAERLERTGSLNSAIGSLVASKRMSGPIGIALRNLTAALIQPAWHVRYPLMWIILESLFGPTSSGEIRHQISLNMANFLSKDRSTRQQIYEKIKRGYAWRSKVVHGRTLSKLDSDRAKGLIADTEGFVKASMAMILADPKLTELFSGPDKEREKYLNELLFS